MDRVLITGMPPYQNGIATSMLGLHRNIDRTRIQFDYLLFDYQRKLSDDASHRAEIESLGGRVFYADYGKNSFPENSRSVIRNIIDNNPDIVGVHMCAVKMDDIFPILYASERKLPIRTIHCHAGLPRREKDKFKDFWNDSRKIISGDDYIRLACSDLAGIRLYGDVPFTVLPNGVDTRRFDWNPAYRKALRRGIGVGEDTLVIGSLGGIYRTKNPKHIIRVFRSLKEKHRDAILLMVGTGSSIREVKNYAKELDVFSSVIFAGEQTQPEMFYHAMDCLLMPSFREGMPNVAIEAQVTGLPCLVSDTVTEMVRLTPSLSFLSITESAETWAETAYIAIRENERRSYAEEIREQGFDIRDTAKSLTDMYCERL